MRLKIDHVPQGIDPQVAQKLRAIAKEAVEQSILQKKTKTLF